jgi:hypothetical protein
MNDASQIIAWTAAAGSLIAAVVTAWVKLRKAKSDVTIEQKKLADAEAKDAYAEAKAALLLLVTSLQSRIEIIEAEQKADRASHTKELREVCDKHHKCEVDMANLTGKMLVMEKDLERLKDHDKRGTQHVAVMQDALVEKAISKIMDPPAPKT